MRRLLDFVSWGFLFAFFVPSVLIVASWYSLPGDMLYGTKLVLERAILTFASPSYAVESQLNIKYTERRFAENRRLLADRHSVVGLPYLEAQVAATKAVIYRAPTLQTKTHFAREYITTLQEVSLQLEQDKQAIVGGQVTQTQAEARSLSQEQDDSVPFAQGSMPDTAVSVTPSPRVTESVSSPAATVFVTVTPPISPATVVPSVTPSVAVVFDTLKPTQPLIVPSVTPMATSANYPSDIRVIEQEITETQATIDETIQELSRIVEGSPDASSRPAGRASIQEQEDREKEKDVPEEKSPESSTKPSVGVEKEDTLSPVPSKTATPVPLPSETQKSLY